MATRMLKESVCTSENIQQLTWFGEVCFYRLLVHCDDFGRMDARLPVLRGRLFPLKTSVTEAEIEVGLQQLERVGLIGLYEENEKRYLQVLGWKKHQRIRFHRAQYPPAPWEDVEQT